MRALDIEQTAADWLVKRTSGTWTGQDQTEFDAWIDASLAHRIAYVRLEAIWNQTGRLQALAAGTPPRTTPSRGAWLNTGSLPATATPGAPGCDSSPVASSKRRRLVTLAASIMVLVTAVSIVGYVLWPDGDRYATSVGAIDTVPLIDGSQVTLNTDTRLRVTMNPTERLIELDQGEAYFEVEKDPSRPFIVNAGDKRVVAVGTKFSVRRDVNDVRVVVTEGAVRFEACCSRNDPPDPGTAGSGAAKLLSAGSIARTRAGDVVVANEPLDQIKNRLSWRSGYLVFHDTPLADAVAEFNRYNHRRIVIADPAISAIQVGGNFKSDSTEVFLWMLQNGFHVDVDTEGEDIVLKSR